MNTRFRLIAALFAAGLSLLGTVTAQAAADHVSGQVAIYATQEQLQGLTLLKYLPHAGIAIVAAEPGREMALVKQLRASRRKAGLNRLAYASALPNDPYYGLQWHFDKVQAEQAWDLSDGSGVTVAVLDTGLASGATDGIGCVTAAWDVVNGDAQPEDGNGHGTHVSGTIAQASDNGIGVAGLAYGACIMPVKVLSDSGSGGFADIADGIYYAVDNGAKVINMSLGSNARLGYSSDPVMDPALDYAYSHGVTVVAASGNDGSRKNVSYPAIYPTTIAVGATDFRDQVTRYSNKGTGLDLVAPGGDTGRDDNKDGYGDGVLQETRESGAWGYYFFQGTSMASPHVAAISALLISHGSATTPDQVRQTLTGTSKDIYEAGYDNTSGYGLVQAFAALGGQVTPPPPACTDADNDGWCAVDDCNDNDSKVYPGANDTRGRFGRDGVDNDCNGIIDG